MTLRPEDPVTLESFDELEKLGVYIHYSPEHYTDGSNLNFSIEFRRHGQQTGWWNDNHEFGGVYETMVKSVKIARWYLEDEARIAMIGRGPVDPGYWEYNKAHHEFLSTLTNWG